MGRAPGHPAGSRCGFRAQLAPQTPCINSSPLSAVTRSLQPSPGHMGRERQGSVLRATADVIESPNPTISITSSPGELLKNSHQEAEPGVFQHPPRQSWVQPLRQGRRRGKCAKRKGLTPKPRGVSPSPAASQARVCPTADRTGKNRARVCPRPAAPSPAGCSRASRFSSKTLGASSPGTAAAGRAKGSSSELTKTPKVNRCPPCSARARRRAALPAEPATHFPPWRLRWGWSSLPLSS